MIVAVDYASIDGNRAPDFAMAKTMCASFMSKLQIAILRAAWGTSPDPTARRDWQRAIDAGLLVGGYLALRVPSPPYFATPEDQVDVFYDSMPRLGPGHLPPIIDVEDRGSSANAEIAWVRRAWNRVKELYGIPPMLYTSARVWREDIGDLPAGEMVDSPLWLAKPWPQPIRRLPLLAGNLFATGKLDPVVPTPWGRANWWMHQYQGDALGLAGFPNTVDLSRFWTMLVGEQGPRVAWAQRRLGIAESAVFDAKMRGAVVAYQTAHGLVADGIIGPVTGLSHLAWEPPRSIGPA